MSFDVMPFDYSSRLQKIEAVLTNTLPEKPDSEWFRRIFFDDGEEFRLPPGSSALLEPCIDLLGRGGKRWRPLLMLLVCEALDGGEAALPLAPLVEFCHNASLIHDDIEDSSEERRGKPAVHLLYGTDTAINSGSFLYFLPLSCIDGWDAPCEAKLRLYSFWAREMRVLHFGQSLDIAWHRNWNIAPSIDDYYKMCASKTGVLARFAARTGALAAAYGRKEAAEKENSAAVSLFVSAAEKLGVGFQIIDDVKNLTVGVSGKRRGDDIVEGKKSLPVLLYLNGASRDGAELERRLALVKRCFAAAEESGNPAHRGVASHASENFPPEVEELINALDEAGCIEKAAGYGRGLLAEAGRLFDSACDSAGTSGGEARFLLAGFTGLIT
ncbi:MAG: polyprenyl synthetase family protein [Spirochaetaceae bacterium]|jgi:octaprenyl-diphosphate synthase|nr:polyprenyl synthetase family protein [Spirochaetaceae bacterium]